MIFTPIADSQALHLRLRAAFLPVSMASALRMGSQCPRSRPAQKG